MTQPHRYPFGIIGNCTYLSYIDKTANVVWQCWPRFDSSFVFGGLLDEEKGGYFYIRPANGEYTSRQYYQENTNILVTEFDCIDGAFRVIDFAPRFVLFERWYKPGVLIRKVELISGSPRIQAGCKPVGQYGERQPKVSQGSNHIEYQGLDTEIRLTTNMAKTHLVDELPFCLSETKYLVLTYGQQFEAPLESTCDEFLHKTQVYWYTWVKRSTIPTIFQKQVIRSGLLLKLHQFDDTGAIIASGTTSLPEYPGSGRNWDYRYCWIRDSFYTLEAFNFMGHYTELQRYSHFIQDVVQGSVANIQPVYQITGLGEIKESELPLKGYLGEKPVRIGNAAYTQVQYDVFGQILLSLLPLYVDARFEQDPPPPISLIERLLLEIDKVMDMPDAGIWEFRGHNRKHAHTYLFHWAGAKAAQKIGSKYNNMEILEHGLRLEEEAREYIERCYRPEKGYYASTVDGNDVDASDLLLILLNYLEHDSPRAISHLAHIEKELTATDGLLYRYKHNDDFGTPESAFLVCSLWYIESLACVGRIEDAIEQFDKVLTYGNEQGLFSEDICPTDFSQWGNCPQTYSHVGIINAAFRISNRVDRPFFY